MQWVVLDVIAVMPLNVHKYILLQLATHMTNFEPVVRASRPARRRVCASRAEPAWPGTLFEISSNSISVRTRIAEHAMNSIAQRRAA